MEKFCQHGIKRKYRKLTEEEKFYMFNATDVDIKFTHKNLLRLFEYKLGLTKKQINYYLYKQLWKR